MHPVLSYCTAVSRCTVNRTLNSSLSTHFTVAPKEVFYYVNAWVQTLLIFFSWHFWKITHVHTEQWHVKHDLLIESAVVGAAGGPRCFLGRRRFKWSRNLCNKWGAGFSWKRNLVPWSSGLWRVFQSTLKMKKNGSVKSLVATHQNTRRRNRQGIKTEQTFIKLGTSLSFPQGSHETSPHPLNLYLSHSF